MESHSPYSWQTVLCHSLIHWSALPETFIIRPLSAVQAVGTHQFLDGGQKTADMFQTTEEGPGCVCCSRPSLIHSNTYKNTLKKYNIKLGIFSSLGKGRWVSHYVSMNFYSFKWDESVIHIHIAIKYLLTF